MCCGRGPSGPTQFVYDDGNGNVTTFATEIEAKAAKVRNGNVGVVRAA